MSLGQPYPLDSTARDGHMGGDFDSEILGEAHGTLTAYTGRDRYGNPTNPKFWQIHKGKAVTCEAMSKTAAAALSGIIDADGAEKGYLTLSGDNKRVHGKLLSADDDGRGAIGCIGFNMWFPVKDDITLSHESIGLPIVGGGDGTVKPLVKPADASALTDIQLLAISNARGIITDYDNTTGAKYVQVNLWA